MIKTPDEARDAVLQAAYDAQSARLAAQKLDATVDDISKMAVETMRFDIALAEWFAAIADSDSHVQRAAAAVGSDEATVERALWGVVSVLKDDLE